MDGSLIIPEELARNVPNYDQNAQQFNDLQNYFDRRGVNMSANPRNFIQYLYHMDFNINPQNPNNFREFFPRYYDFGVGLSEYIRWLMEQRHWRSRNNRGPHQPRQPFEDRDNLSDNGRPYSDKGNFTDLNNTSYRGNNTNNSWSDWLQHMLNNYGRFYYNDDFFIDYRHMNDYIKMLNEFLGKKRERELDEDF